MTNLNYNEIAGQTIMQGEELLEVPTVGEVMTRVGDLLEVIGGRVEQENKYSQPEVFISVVDCNGEITELTLSEVSGMEFEYLMPEGPTDEEINSMVQHNANDLMPKIPKVGDMVGTKYCNEYYEVKSIRAVKDVVFLKLDNEDEFPFELTLPQVRILEGYHQGMTYSQLEFYYNEYSIEEPYFS